MGNKVKKLVVLTTSLMCLLTAFTGCAFIDNLFNKDSSSDDSSSTNNSSGGGQTSRPTFALENDRVELETEEDLDLLTAFNDYAGGGGEPTISLDTSVKKFGEASIKVENPANSKYNSNNSWPSVEVAFSNPQDFSTKKYTQFHVYSAESEPFVMNVQFSVDGTSGYKSNMRQINPGWNVIEITNNVSRDFSLPVDFSKVTSFIFSVWGHATETCTYYIDDIVLTDTTAQTGDIYELVSFDETKYVETKGSNFMLPYTMFTDAVPSTPTALALTDDGSVLFTQYLEWHFIGINGFNTAIFNYDVLSVDFENVSDFAIEVGIAAEGGDYSDGGPRIAPSATMVRKSLQPGEKATLTIELANVLTVLRNASTSLSLDNLAYFHIFSTGSMERTFAVSSMKLLTENGIVLDAAQKVDKKIAKLPATADLQMKDIAFVEEIRAQYTALSDEAKALVENLAVLEAAEDAIANFGEDVYVQGVEDLIAALPAANELTLEDAETVAEVRATFNTLSDAAKALVENVAVLEAAETKIDELTGKVVKDAIAALPSVDEITLLERATVIEIREAYEALTEAQQAYVDNLATLETLEAKIQELLGGQAVVEMINTLKQEGAYTGEDVAAILAARNAYAALSADEKADVVNLSLLQAAEAKMLAVKTFSATADANDMMAGLYGPLSQCKVETGYVEEIGGKTGGFGWYSTKYRSDALMSEDTNGDGHANDQSAGFFGVKLAPMHDKTAYQALLDAGYTTITLSIYVEAEAGAVAFFCRPAYDGAFTWYGTKTCGEWHELEISLEMFVANYNNVASGDWFLLGSEVNMQTELMTVYISDVAVKALTVVEPNPDPTPADFAAAVDAMIEELKQEGAYTGDDVNAILEAREAYDALGDEAKALIEKLALLQAAEARMLSVYDFTAENISNFKAGLYGGYSACTMESGYTTETIGGVTGAAWFSSKYAEGALLDDPNNDGFANDHQFIGYKYQASHDKSAYQALLDAGYTTISFSFYQVADAGSIGWGNWLSAEKFTHVGKVENNTWVNVEITLADFIKYFDEIHGSDKFYILGGDVNKDAGLTTVYLSDVTVAKS